MMCFYTRDPKLPPTYTKFCRMLDVNQISVHKRPLNRALHMRIRITRSRHSLLIALLPLIPSPTKHFWHTPRADSGLWLVGTHMHKCTVSITSSLFPPPLLLLIVDTARSSPLPVVSGALPFLLFCPCSSFSALPPSFLNVRRCPEGTILGWNSALHCASVQC